MHNPPKCQAGQQDAGGRSSFLHRCQNMNTKEVRMVRCNAAYLLTSWAVGVLKVNSMRAASLSFLLTWLIFRGGSFLPASATGSARLLAAVAAAAAGGAPAPFGVFPVLLLLSSRPWLPPLPPMDTATATAAALSAAARRGGLL